MSSGNALISSLSTFFSFLFECLKQEGVYRNVLSTVLLLNSVASYRTVSISTLSLREWRERGTVGHSAHVHTPYQYGTLVPVPATASSFFSLSKKRGTDET